MDGGAHADTLNGGEGDDILRGGSRPEDYDERPDEADLFVFEGAVFGRDVILDFSIDGGDVIQFDGSVLKDFEAVRSMMRQVDQDTVIDLGNGSSITLTNIRSDMLSANDFVFQGGGIFI